MALTDSSVRNAKPSDKSYRLFDSRGLSLEVEPNGGKWWRFKYRFYGKEKVISLGTYPDMSLYQAREGREEARRQISEGIDPSEYRKAVKTAKLGNIINKRRKESWLNRAAKVAKVVRAGMDLKAGNVELSFEQYLLEELLDEVFCREFLRDAIDDDFDYLLKVVLQISKAYSLGSPKT